LIAAIAAVAAGVGVIQVFDVMNAGAFVGSACCGCGQYSTWGGGGVATAAVVLACNASFDGSATDTVGAAVSCFRFCRCFSLRSENTAPLLDDHLTLDKRVPR
jgi:hypothetical protein